MSETSSQLPQISEAEWLVMRLFWERGELSTGDVISAFEGNTDWNPKTIQTLIRRLHKKGALDVTSKNGREFIYSATVTDSECQHAASQSFLGRIFDGKLTPFVANLVENQKVSEEEINELKRLLDRAAEEQKKNGGKNE